MAVFVLVLRQRAFTFRLQRTREYIAAPSAATPSRKKIDAG